MAFSIHVCRYVIISGKGGFSMRPKTWTAVLLLATGPWVLAQEQARWHDAKLADAEFKVRLIRDTAEMQSLFGSDLDGEFLVAEVDVRPLYNTNVVLDRSDFLMRSYSNNDTSMAQSPDRIAGSSILVLGTGGPTRVEGGGVFSESRDPTIIGGAPGTGSRPRSLGSPDNVAIGSGTTSTTGIRVDQEERPAGTLLERLQQMELPIGETRGAPVRGYLYFQLNPKHKPKHLALSYDGSAGEFKISFKKD
jgi:hypothetical protein